VKNKGTKKQQKQQQQTQIQSNK